MSDKLLIERLLRQNGIEFTNIGDEENGWYCVQTKLKHVSGEKAILYFRFLDDHYFEVHIPYPRCNTCSHYNHKGKFCDKDKLNYVFYY